MKKILLLILASLLVLGIISIFFNPTKPIPEVIKKDLTITGLSDLDSLSRYYNHPLDTSEVSAEWLYQKAMTEYYLLDGGFSSLIFLDKKTDSRTAMAIRAMELSAIIYEKLGKAEMVLKTYRMLVFADFSFRQPDSVFSQYKKKINTLQDSVLGWPDPPSNLNFSNDERIKLGAEIRKKSIWIKLLWSTDDNVYTEKIMHEKWGKGVWLAEDFFIASAIFIALNQTEDAIKCLKAAEDLYRLYDSPLKLNTIYLTLTEYLRMIGNTKECEEYQKKMLKTANYNGEFSPMYIWSLASLGQTYQRNGKIKEALKTFEEAENQICNLPKEIILEEMVGGAESVMALNYLRLGMLNKADIHFNNSLDRLERLRSSFDEEGEGAADFLKIYTPAYGNLTQYAFMKGQLERSINHARITNESLDKYKEIVLTPNGNDIWSKIASYINKKNYKIVDALNYATLASVNIKLQEYQTAIHYYQMADDNFGMGKKSRTRVNVLLNRVDAHIQIGELNKALKYTREVEKLVRDQGYNGLIPRLHQAFFRLDLKQKNYESAMNQAKLMTQSAKQISDILHIQKGLLNQADVNYRIGDYNQALHLLVDSIDQKVFFEEKNAYLEFLKLKGSTLLKLERHQEALEIFKRGIRFVESEYIALNGELSSQIVIQKAIEIYDGAVQAAILLNKPHRALEIYEQSKTKALSRLLLSKEYEINARPDLLIEKDKFELEIKLNNYLRDSDDLDEQAREQLLMNNIILTQKIAGLNNQIIQESGNHIPLKADTISVEQIQTNLKEDQVMIEYILTNSQAFAFIIDQKNIVLTELGSTYRIQAAFEEFSNIFLQQKGENIQKRLFFRSASKLYQLLIKPLYEKAELKGKKLLFVPDGILYKLPFELLINDKRAKAHWHEYHYLIEDYEISYFPSATTFIYLQNNVWSDSETKSKILLAAPKYSKSDHENSGSRTSESYRSRKAYRDGKLSQLHFTKGEVEGIAKLFRSDEVTMWVDSMANELNIKKYNDELKLQQFEIIHFAAHAIIDETYPQLSSIFFMTDPDSLEDGRIQLFEITDLKLNAELVVLSACESGLGKVIRGEGIIGYMRSLMYAGSQAVMLSLWSVDDQSTSILMQNYYEELVNGESTDKYTPLRKAQLRMINQNNSHSNPYYWAPFVLMGNKISL